MARLNSVILIIILFTACSPSPDFQNSHWGMSREQVLQAEGQPFSSSPDELVYHKQYMGWDSTLTFLSKKAFGE